MTTGHTALDDFLTKLMSDQSRLQSKKASREPEVGIFWVMPIVPQPQPKLVALGTPVSEVPDYGGFKTEDKDHYSTWEYFQHIGPSYADYDYDYWPRGRVNWIASTGKFLVVADKKINKVPYLSKIMGEFNLPRGKVDWNWNDQHYKSKGSI